MPEGPEIHRAAAALARVLVGRVLEDVEIALPCLAVWSAVLRGRQVTAVESRGKAMLVRMAGGLNLYSHNQLYGLWQVAPRGRIPDIARVLRVALHTDTHSALLYSASAIEVLADADLGTHAYLRRLGPDALDPGVREMSIRQRLLEPRFRRRSLAALLLDQGFVAGIGNYLRSEILFDAELAPERRPGECTADELGRLAHSILGLPRRSRRTGGVVVDARLAAAARARGDTREQYRFYVFGREGQPCRRCEQTIRRRNPAGRGLFYCPACQSARRPRSGAVSRARTRG